MPSPVASCSRWPATTESRWRGDYRIGLNETAIGAAFPPVALEIVRLRLTHGATSELLLGAELYPASALVRLGVVTRLSAPADFDDRGRTPGAAVGRNAA